MYCVPSCFHLKASFSTSLRPKSVRSQPETLTNCIGSTEIRTLGLPLGSKGANSRSLKQLLYYDIPKTRTGLQQNIHMARFNTEKFATHTPMHRWQRTPLPTCISCTYSDFHKLYTLLGYPRNIHYLWSWALHDSSCSIWTYSHKSKM